MLHIKDPKKKKRKQKKNMYSVNSVTKYFAKSKKV